MSSVNQNINYRYKLRKGNPLHSLLLPSSSKKKLHKCSSLIFRQAISSQVTFTPLVMEMTSVKNSKQTLTELGEYFFLIHSSFSQHNTKLPMLSMFASSVLTAAKKVTSSGAQSECLQVQGSNGQPTELIWHCL